MIALVVDAPAKNAALADLLGVTFPIYSDPDLELIRAYDIEEVALSIALPSTFLIKEGGEVIYIYVGENKVDRPLIDDVLQAFDDAD